MTNLLTLHPLANTFIQGQPWIHLLLSHVYMAPAEPPFLSKENVGEFVLGNHFL
jgi:hypothetical protein